VDASSFDKSPIQKEQQRSGSSKGGAGVGSMGEVSKIQNLESTSQDKKTYSPSKAAQEASGGGGLR